MKSKYVYRSRISEAKFREIVKLFLTCSPKFEPNPELDYHINASRGSYGEHLSIASSLPAFPLGYFI